MKNKILDIVQGTYEYLTEAIFPLFLGGLLVILSPIWFLPYYFFVVRKERLKDKEREDRIYKK